MSIKVKPTASEKNWCGVVNNPEVERATIFVVMAVKPVRKYFFLLLFLILACCPHRSQINRFFSSNSPPVEVGFYPYYISPLPSNHPIMEKATNLRKDIESNEPILRKLVRENIGVKAPLEFKFQYLGKDSIHQRLILTYFARNYQPEMIAGWRVSLVYSLPHLKLLCAYVAEVPLD
ncbi:MAG: hypothetical protein ABIK39_05275 [candidate division WOR-3 bacterium]